MVDLSSTPAPGAGAVHADAAAYAPHPPRLRYEPADRRAHRGLLSAPASGRSFPSRAWAADAPELLRRLQAAVNAEGPRASSAAGAHSRREAEQRSLCERPGVGPSGLEERQPVGVPRSRGPDAGRV